MSKASKFERRQKKARRVKNRREREANIAALSSEVRVRNPFKAKARRGDEAVLDFVFADTAVPFDPADPDPSASVKRRHDAVEAWAEIGNPTVGEA
jgi:hypothetical protein